MIAKVVEKFVLQLEAQLGDRNVTIELSDEASRWLIANGYDELMGARPMARVIQEHIKKPLADEVLFGHLKNGGHVRVIVDKDEEGRDKLGFEFLDGPVTPKPEKLPARPKAKRRAAAAKAEARLGAEGAAGQGLGGAYTRYRQDRKYEAGPRARPSHFCGARMHWPRPSCGGGRAMGQA